MPGHRRLVAALHTAAHIITPARSAFPPSPHPLPAPPGHPPRLPPATLRARDVRHVSHNHPYPSRNLPSQRSQIQRSRHALRKGSFQPQWDSPRLPLAPGCAARRIASRVCRAPSLLHRPISSPNRRRIQSGFYHGHRPLAARPAPLHGNQSVRNGARGPSRRNRKVRRKFE